MTQQSPSSPMTNLEEEEVTRPQMAKAVLDISEMRRDLSDRVEALKRKLSEAQRALENSISRERVEEKLNQAAEVEMAALRKERDRIRAELDTERQSIGQKVMGRPKREIGRQISAFVSQWEKRSAQEKPRGEEQQGESSLQQASKKEKVEYLRGEAGELRLLFRRLGGALSKDEAEELRMDLDKALRKVETLNQETKGRLGGELRISQEEAQRLRHEAQQKASSIKQDLTDVHRRDTGLEQQLQQLKDRIKSSENKVHVQTKQLLKLSSIQSDLDAQKRLLAKAEARNKSLLAEGEADQKRISLLRRINQEFSRGETKNWELMKHLEEAREEITNLKTKLQDQSILVVQKAAWQEAKEKAREKSMVVYDDEMREKFEVDIESRTRQWAYRYAVSQSELDQVKGTWTKENIKRMEKELEKIGGHIGQLDPVAFCRRYDPDIIAHAILSQFVTEQIFKKPFLLFELIAGRKFAKIMMIWYESMSRDDPQAALKWRCSELHRLSNSLLMESKPKGKKAPSPSAIPPVLKHKREDRIHSYFTGLAAKFLKSPVRILLNDKTSSLPANRTLVSLFLNAAQAGLMMWRSPLDIHIRGLEELAGRNFALEEAEDGTGGGVGDTRTHPSQTGRGFGGPGNVDPVVDMVVQPAIVVRQENGTEKVWSQAIVLWA